MSTEDSIMKQCSIGDIVTYRDENGVESRGKCIGWTTHHSGQRYMLVMVGHVDIPLPLYRILSRQRGAEIVHFRKQPTMV